jgi:hypothetical protein
MRTDLGKYHSLVLELAGEPRDRPFGIPGAAEVGAGERAEDASTM